MWLKSVAAVFNAKMMLAIVLATLAAGTAGYWRGASVTRTSIEADVLREEQLAQRVYQQAQLATAGEIAKIQIINKTVTNELEREIRIEPVYRDCNHPESVKRLLDAILTGQAPAESFGRDSLPGVDAPQR
jgi:hypothetical protein